MRDVKGAMRHKRSPKPHVATICTVADAITTAIT